MCAVLGKFRNSYFRRFLRLLRIVLLLVIVGGFSTTAAEEKVKIGVSLALTGSAATYGGDIRNVLEFANEKLTNSRYELVFDDDRCNGRDAVTVAHRFIDVMKLNYVSGFACSSALLPSASLYEKARVITITPSASAADISKAGDFIFRTCPSDKFSAKRLYEYIAPRHKKFGFVSEQTDAVQGFLNSFIEANEGGALQIVNENFLTETTDFRSLLLKLRAKNIDGLHLNCQTEQTLLAVLKQVRAMGWSVPLYNVYFAGSPALLEKAQGASEGVVYVDLPNVRDVLTAEGKLLYEEFEKKYGGMKSIDLYFATGFEALRAIDAAAQSGKEPREFLYGTKFHGLLGDWSFDRNGDIQGLNFVIKVVRGNKSIVLE